MRVLQAGFGAIGKEVWTDYAPALQFHTYMVTDPRVPAPEGYEWDGDPVDLAVILVDTPRGDTDDGFEYGDLLAATEQYLEIAGFVLIRSTVGPGFLDTPIYRDNVERIGLAPEFYGSTKWSSRGVLTLGFSIFTPNVPDWFVKAAGRGEILVAEPLDTVIAKLAENAFLAMKVTFFHELALTCDKLGADFESVRELVTSDPRITPHHSHVEELGWTSHCMDKDVPAFTLLGGGAHTELVQAAIQVNTERLLPRR